MSSLTQILGAVLVLAAFALAQARVVTPEARTYLVMNVVGGSVLAVDAYIGEQWGFLLLEGVWAFIAAWGLLRPWDPVRRSLVTGSHQGRMGA